MVGSGDESFMKFKQFKRLLDHLSGTPGFVIYMKTDIGPTSGRFDRIKRLILSIIIVVTMNVYNQLPNPSTKYDYSYKSRIISCTAFAANLFL
jgi:hypothetical protein